MTKIDRTNENGILTNNYQNVKQNKSIKIKISEKGRILLSKNPITKA